ncbi:hypothetical protein JCM5350_001308 [Sporobolomyces pararoseus]
MTLPYQSSYGVKPAEELEDKDEPNNEEFKHALSRMIGVKDLYISCFERIALLIVSSDVASTSLPHLHTLSLQSFFPSLNDPFHSSHYISLPLYSSLRSFRLHVLIDELDISPSSPPTSISHTLNFDSLSEVSISGPILASPEAENLIGSFTSVTKLSLHDRYGSRILNKLQAVAKPELIEELTLDCVEENMNLPTSTSSLNVFSAFPNLRSLSIRGKIDHPFYQLLQRLKTLEVLQFDRNMTLLETEVIRIVDSLRLKTLILDSPSASLSSQFWRYFPGSAPKEGQEEDLDWMFEYAEWTNEFSKEGLRRLMRRCEEKGVEIKGAACEALVLEAKWDSGEFKRERSRRFRKLREQGIIV